MYVYIYIYIYIGFDRISVLSKSSVLELIEIGVNEEDAVKIIQTVQAK